MITGAAKRICYAEGRMKLTFFGKSRPLTATLVIALTMLAAPNSGAHEGLNAVPAKTAATPVLANSAIAVVDAFHAALSVGDTGAALALLTDDVLVLEMGGVERSKAEYAAHHLQADAEFSQVVTRKLESRASGGDDNFAWVTSTEKVTGTLGGRSIKSRSVETMLLIKSGTEWRITHIHWSSAKL
jgi:ketosteroid isomerase-like protein